MSYQKALLIYNPNSGNRKIPKILDEIIEILIQKNILTTSIRLDDKLYKDLNDILKTYEYDIVIAAGGDGTIMMVAQAMLDSDVKKPLGVLGAGTCNNFALNIGMPDDIMQSAAIIAEGKSDYVDYGLANDKLFLSSIAAGVFAQISFETGQDIKERIGPLAYYLQGITQLNTIKVNDFEITVDGVKYNKSAYLVMVLTGSNVGSMTGLMEDEIKIKDGIFELLVVNESNPIDLGELLLKVIRNEDISNPPSIEVFKGHEFEIDCKNPDIAVSIDGEKGPALPIKIKVQQKALNVLVAKKLK